MRDHLHTAPILLLKALILFAPLAVRGQELAWEITSTELGFPGAVYDLGDVTGDGVNDVLRTNPIASVNGVSNSGIIQVLSGLDGTLLYELSGPQMNTNQQSHGVLGDLDGDGVDDFHAVHAGLTAGQVRSGLDGSVIGNLSFSQGSSIVPIGDVNLDGWDDFAVGNSGGAVTVFAGPFPPTVLYIVFDPLGGTDFGRFVAPIGDLDADGIGDILVGAPGFPFPFMFVLGWAYALSGVDGSIIHTWVGPSQGSHFGMWPASAGDVDGDGIEDVLVGAPQLGDVFLFSGQNGAQIAVIDDPPPAANNTGNRLCDRLGDVDGDGVEDFAILDFDTFGLELRSGGTLGPLGAIVPPSGAGVQARSFDGLGDLDFDDAPDLVASTFGDARLQAWSLAPPGVEAFGQGCALSSGTVPRIGATGPPALGSTFTLNVSKVPPQTCTGLVLGLSDTQTNAGVSLPLDLGSAGLPGCSLLTSFDFFLEVFSTQVAPGSGAAQVPFQIPNDPALFNIAFYAQWAVANPPSASTPAALTRGLEIIIQ